MALWRERPTQAGAWLAGRGKAVAARLIAALRPTIVPTPRACAVLGGLALLALGLAAVAPGAWLAAPVLGLLVLGLSVADGILAGRLIALDIAAPAEVEVGREGAIALSARVSGTAPAIAARLMLDARLAPGGQAGAMLPASEGLAQGAVLVTPTRRCLGRIEAAWLRWNGPLGLGARQYRRDVDATIAVVPDIAPLRQGPLQTFLRDSQMGMIARRLRGEGTMFETLAEYQPGMDRRRIDWKVSARHAHLYAKEYEAERNNQIVFAVDCGQAMCEPVAGLSRLDRAVSAALACTWVAVKGGDRVALFGFAAKVRLLTPFATDTQGFASLRAAAATLDYEAREPNYTLALATLASRLQRRSLIVVFSDFTDPTSAEMMVEAIGRLVARHRVLFVTLRDEELDGIAGAAPADAREVAMAVAADALLRQRALVTGRLRAMGVDVVEAPHTAIGPRLIDAYLALKRAGGIG